MKRTLCAALVAVAVHASAMARADSWAVIPVGIGEAPSRALSVAATSAATLETSGATVFQAAQLTHRVENEVSQPFSPAPAELVARLDQLEHDLAVAVAQRRHAEILSATRGLFDELRPHLAAIHRSDDASADLSNLCGYRVFAAQAADRSGEAAARECFELVPRFSPDRGLHRPEVLELVARVGGALPGAIVVESSPDDPPNCTVRVNGVRVGQSPGARVAVPAGAYAVQLECRSEPGRVHRIQVGTGDVSVRVRASLDAALVSRPVSLVYGSSSALSSLPGDVAELGRAVGADRVLAVVEGPSGVALRAFAVPDSGPARQLRESTLAPGSDDARIRASVAALAGAGRPGTAADSRGSISPVGPILLGIGGASLLAGVIVFGVTVAENDALLAMCVEGVCPTSARPHAQSVETLGLAADITLIGGAVVAATGLALTLLLRDGPAEDSPVAIGCGPTGCGVELRGSF